MSARAAAALALAATVLAAQPSAQAPNPPARRVILFKFDGLNAGLVEKYIDQKNARTGRSQLPWISQIFSSGGTRLQNFFVRGISLSAPSWAELDTGAHSVIRGNVEYDRWTLHAYDYLNFVPFYLNYSQKKQVDMPGPEVLDDAGIPLLLDAFQPQERRQSYQLYQRGNDWRILKNSVPDHFKSRSARQIFDEYETGLDLAATIPQEEERLLNEALADNRIAYFDFFSGDYDHIAHLTTDPASQLAALQALDALVGRIWTAARAAPLGPATLFVIVSDHGMNTSPRVQAQGYSLVQWFNSADGGAQHVVTDRYPLSTFKIRGLDPLVHKVTTPSSESTYLRGEAEHYPTVLLDLDGNERAAVQLRSNDWNIAQILLQSANNPQTPEAVKTAARAELSRWAEARRSVWYRQKQEIEASLEAAKHSIAYAEGESVRLTRDFSDAEKADGAYLEPRRWAVLAERLREQQREYGAFLDSMDSFLAMPANAAASLVPRQSLGDANSLYDLQNYVVGPDPQGLKLDANNRLDLDRSFQRIDYFAALHSIHVRNQPPPGVSNRPVDFDAVGLPVNAVEQAAHESNLLAAVWLYGSPEHQALVLYRENLQNAAGALEIRYLPIAQLHAAKDGSLTFQSASCGAGFPLALCEDPALTNPLVSSPQAWLTGWHSERDWFACLVHARYSNALIGLSELFRPLIIQTSPLEAALSPHDRQASLRFEQLRRSLVQPDFEIFASDHWDFNVRNFNPGGNHGAFWQESTRSVLMFSGPSIPAGSVIGQPYDSLSLAPTILGLLGRSLPDLVAPPIAFRQ